MSKSNALMYSMIVGFGLAAGIRVYIAWESLINLAWGGLSVAKSPAERKAAQRARLAESGNRKLELQLDEQELEMLARNCAARRPGRAPYDMNEYIALLIRQDDTRVRGRIKSISANKCGKCGDALPVESCPCDGDSECWVTRGWHETKLPV